MNKTTLLAVILLSLAVLPPTTASAESSAVPVRLGDATDAAVSSRPELRMELQQEEIARSRVREAKGNFLPTVDLQASSYYVRNFDTFTGINVQAQILGYNVTVTLGKEVPSYQLNGELNINYNVYAGGRDKAILGEAKANLESAKYRESATLRKIRLDVANAYWELKKTQVRHEMAKRSLELVRLEKKVAETEHQVGRRSDEDYQSVLLKNREKEVALRSADRDCQKAYGNYLHVVGLPEEGKVPPAEEIPALVDDPENEKIPAEEEAVHPDILRLKSEINAAAEREKTAKSENYPKIDLFAKYSVVGRSSNNYIDSLGDARSEYYMVGLRLTANLFNGFRTTEQVRQARMDSRLKQLQLAQKERELAEARHSRHTALESANDQYLLAVERRKVEEAREETARTRLRSGKISELEYRQLTVSAADAADEVTLAKVDVALADNALKLLVLE